jgi:hypothetical protein
MFELHQRALVVIACLAMSFWLPTQAESAHAAPRSACTSDEGKIGNLNVSSVVQNSQVKLCAAWSKTTPKSRSSQKSLTTHTETTPNQKSQGAKRSSPKTKIDLILRTKAGKKITFTHEVSAKPVTPRIEQSANQVDVGQKVRFIASTRSHSRYRMLLGVPTEIRFRPIVRSWSLQGSHLASTSALTQQFSVPGLFRVNLSVTYEIWYRVWSKGKFRKLNQTITLPALPAEIFVSAKQKSPRFVVYACRDQPAAWGCQD